MNNLRLETNGTNKHVKIFAPNGDEIGGIISVELPPIDRQSDGRVTITCYLDGSPFARSGVLAQDKISSSNAPTEPGLYEFRGHRKYGSDCTDRRYEWTPIHLFKLSGELVARFEGEQTASLKAFSGEWRKKPLPPIIATH